MVTPRAQWLGEPRTETRGHDRREARGKSRGHNSRGEPKGNRRRGDPREKPRAQRQRGTEDGGGRLTRRRRPSRMVRMCGTFSFARSDYLKPWGRAEEKKRFSEAGFEDKHLNEWIL